MRRVEIATAKLRLALPAAAKQVRTLSTPVAAAKQPSRQSTPTLKASTPNAASRPDSGPQVHDDDLPTDDDMPTMEELVKGLQDALRQAEIRIAEHEKALQATDLGAQVVNLTQRLERAQRSLEERMAVAVAEQKLARDWARQLDRIGKAIGVSDKWKVAPAIEAMVRAARKAA